MTKNLQSLDLVKETIKIIVRNSLATKATKIKIDTGFPHYGTLVIWIDDAGIPESQHTGFIAEDETKPEILSGIDVVQMGKVCERFIINTTRKAIPLRYKFSFIFGPTEFLQNITSNRFEENPDEHFTEITFQSLRVPIPVQLKKNGLSINDILTPTVEKTKLNITIDDNTVFPY